jgi:hypothetical protein
MITESFDSREAGNARVEVPRDDIQAMSWQGIPSLGRLLVYTPELSGKPPSVDLTPPSASFPLLQSYIDVVVEGGLEYGPAFAREIIETTTGWSRYWLNDREEPRRPWVFDKRSAEVDKLLAQLVPRFKDRLYPEQYAERELLAK